MSGEKESGVTCRICGFGPYIPTCTFDFYQDNKAGPGTGYCEKCMRIGAYIPDPV